MDYSAIADTLGRSEAACRQLAARGREHVRDERPRFAATDEERDKLTTAFHAALVGGDLASLARMLADDATLYTDGGGKQKAALNPIYGKDKILRFMLGVARKGMPVPQAIERAQINGLPGFLLRFETVVETVAIEISGEHIVAIYQVRNPDKLRHLS